MHSSNILQLALLLIKASTISALPVTKPADSAPLVTREANPVPAAFPPGPYSPSFDPQPEPPNALASTIEKRSAWPPGPYSPSFDPQLEPPSTLPAANEKRSLQPPGPYNPSFGPQPEPLTGLSSGEIEKRVAEPFDPQPGPPNAASSGADEAFPPGPY